MNLRLSGRYILGFKTLRFRPKCGAPVVGRARWLDDPPVGNVGRDGARGRRRAIARPADNAGPHARWWGESMVGNRDDRHGDAAGFRRTRSAPCRASRGRMAVVPMLAQTANISAAVRREQAQACAVDRSRGLRDDGHPTRRGRWLTGSFPRGANSRNAFAALERAHRCSHTEGVRKEFAPFGRQRNTRGAHGHE